MPNIANALLLRDGQVLMLRRSLQRKAYPGCWSFPGGHAERGETPDQALLRETREEIDVTPLAYTLLSRVSAFPAAGEPVTFHLYAVREWSGQPAMIGVEHTELRWFALDAAASLPGLALEDYRPLLAALSRGEASEPDGRPAQAHRRTSGGRGRAAIDR